MRPKFLSAGLIVILSFICLNFFIAVFSFSVTFEVNLSVSMGSWLFMLFFVSSM